MSLTASYLNRLSKAWMIVALLAFVEIAVISVACLRVPRESGNVPSVANLVAKPGGTTFDSGSAEWRAFMKRENSGTAGQYAVSKRFRLAGTFFIESDDETSQIRKAVLDDITAKTQQIVSENEEIDGITVLQILKESVLLRNSNGQEERLVLGFAKGLGSSSSLSTATSAQEYGTGGTDAAVLDQFGGRRVGEASWVFSRDTLLGYYDELRNDPERLLKVFDSLKPLRDANSKINGYQLGVEGESAFFTAAGLRDGDVVRAVNSVPMTNRKRAERFLSDFVRDKSNAFVLEIERNGQRQKLIYQIR